MWLSIDSLIDATVCVIVAPMPCVPERSIHGDAGKGDG